MLSCAAAGDGQCSKFHCPGQSCLTLQYQGGPRLSHSAWRSLVGWGFLSFASAALRGPLENGVLPVPGTWEMPRVLTLRLRTGSPEGRSWSSEHQHSSTGRAGTSSHLSEPEGKSWGLSRGAGGVSPASLGDPGPVTLSTFISPSASWGRRRPKGSFQLGLCWFWKDFSVHLPSLGRAGVYSSLVPGLPLCPLWGQMLLLLSPDVRQSPRATEERSEKSWQPGQCPDWGRKVVWRLRLTAHSATQDTEVSPLPPMRGQWTDRLQGPGVGKDSLGRGQACKTMPLSPHAGVSVRSERWDLSQVAAVRGLPVPSLQQGLKCPC
ncbi:uncharacterized protein LOC131835783 [Mustela lutreola]|uniref:uncharacterized protein LOC131835783 n=1 Tax=Mustela lutreola TaxID=9666 RepID=UPI002796EFDB|nr:uncharacterized protein LOC131835783 [Mustela lutreola]XP_059036374.1 uncharacterized protein LOC131835783 [Mustela lutreola]XP_059036375.1 uncharacterized protein LOC131835783 [Mustela lutreola]XP_059036376.1 uncharacterized protein LOC131835783 [Mustela lutreola]XP_059036377.1 uncharacterized protein LOC131835783 [Mustela lutreola]XP_059036378.1 uncharacterized protein LOC131835783 [Mustela lutreola]XP_059036379.1 uncharacterized protein LOC131835783 [Mustela lutreola]XP_059036380.1 unc